MRSFYSVLKRGLTPMNAAAFEAAAEETDALIVDTRHQNDFIKGFIPH